MKCVNPFLFPFSFPTQMALGVLSLMSLGTLLLEFLNHLKIELV